MRIRIGLILFVIGLLLCVTHSKAQEQEVQSPTSYHVKLYDGGTIVNEWDTRGDIDLEYGFVTFTDAGTGKQLQVHGNLEVEKER